MLVRYVQRWVDSNIMLSCYYSKYADIDLGVLE